jgi:hypothetical protein
VGAVALTEHPVSSQQRYAIAAVNRASQGPTAGDVCPTLVKVSPGRTTPGIADPNPYGRIRKATTRVAPRVPASEGRAVRR